MDVKIINLEIKIYKLLNMVLGIDKLNSILYVIIGF